MKDFDIAPFSLPNCASSEVRFEEPRDIRCVRVAFAQTAPQTIRLFYLRKLWPGERFEKRGSMDSQRPSQFGWAPIDDHFNSNWQAAKILTERIGRNILEVTFRGLREELPDFADGAKYNVEFRRTLGIRVESENSAQIKKVQVFTASPPAQSRLRVELNAGKRTAGRTLQITSYNATISRIEPAEGVSFQDNVLKLLSARDRIFYLQLFHMKPAHRYSYDDGMVTFALEHETFTISLTALAQEGPIWFADEGIFITFAEDPTTFRDYQMRIKDQKNIRQRILALPEQSYGGAFHGQPRPHAVSYSLGWKHARQKFWLEPNGDLVMHKHNLTRVEGKDTSRFKNDRHGRFFFGLEKWYVDGRFADSAPVLAYNIHARRGDLRLEQKSFAFPLSGATNDAELAADATIVTMMRFRFQNVGDRPVVASLSIEYASESDRSHNRLNAYIYKFAQDDQLRPLSRREQLIARDGMIFGAWQGQEVMRCGFETPMTSQTTQRGIEFSRELAPGESCDLVLKIPYVALDEANELEALQNLKFDRCLTAVTQYWRRISAHGASLTTPEPHLNALHKAHPSHVFITDSAMPDDPNLVNTSVGTSTYGNFTNESCMINQELDERGLHEEARRRLAVWLKYQGTAKLIGNYSDYNGVFYGAGGFEEGSFYNQHHGWVLWRLAQHYLFTRDKEWLKSVAAAIVAGADWVARQRRQTMSPLPHSRGWEKGFLPAGGLEDVGDFFYWLSTNTLTWRGLDSAAQVLQDIQHADARRLQREADAYRRDLVCGFETMRQHTPLVRLRDGRWVPHYPSRLYRRGRDYGWIREVLEGSVYLLISGLFSPRSKQAQWILDDYLDNRYLQPPMGYPIVDEEAHWFDRGGFSIQPNLLAGLLPHLERDEIEVFLWMFFNAWCACYREEINAMVEHPMPELGFANSAHFKTSDQANAMMWLRYMFVYVMKDTLHLGRAIPRAWFADGQDFAMENVATRFGKITIRFQSMMANNRIKSEIALELSEQPKQIILRFRHPEKRHIKSVTVNGKKHQNFNAKKGDIDITGSTGRLLVEASY